MKKIHFLISGLLLTTVLLSCNDKKLTEVVEVPLPTAQEKIAIGHPDDVKANDGAFQLEKLPYTYDALAPNVSALTMEMHYSKHYLSYANNLNKALAGTDLENLTIEEILAKLDPNNDEIRNNAGGYYNHSLYFKCMTPKTGEVVKDSLTPAITKRFGSIDNFKAAFKEEAEKQFGSAWT
ncbi:MAG: Fe-Mn family superoxide dismutase, partial [Flavobacterium sp.]|uniref:superoxide dismutase n=1 Tax=Flavobacterium sp. TaxID=239 RepID=UPI0026126D5B